MNQDWIKPGADIAVYVDSRDGKHRLQQRKVKTVAATSFTVENIGDRFRLATMSTRGSGGYWSHRYVAVHPDSEEAAIVADRDNRDRVRSAANYYLGGSRVDSLEKVDTAIKELQEWRAILASEYGDVS